MAERGLRKADVVSGLDRIWHQSLRLGELFQRLFVLAVLAQNLRDADQGLCVFRIVGGDYVELLERGVCLAVIQQILGEAANSV